MKLPIMKKYFDQIEAGKKKLEYRDAHITFICEETGRTMTKQVLQAQVVGTAGIRERQSVKDIFDDDFVIKFLLGDYHED